MDLLMLGAEFGTKVIIVAEGHRADEAVSAVSDLIDQGFGEI
jgi:phosphotransferase system HPr-like phosphotransfer protein